MKYKVTIELIISPRGEDEELSSKELLAKADYAINNNLLKYENLVCETIGFPGEIDTVNAELVE